MKAMKQTLECYTAQAMVCRDHASKIAHYNQQTRITPDALFWGIYAFLKQYRFFPLFCAVIGLQKTKALDKIFQTEIQVPMLQTPSSSLPFNKTLTTAFGNKHRSKHSIDPFRLFVIAFENLSSELKNLIQKDKNNLSEIKDTLEYLSNLPVVKSE